MKPVRAIKLSRCIGAALTTGSLTKIIQRFLVLSFLLVQLSTTVSSRTLMRINFDDWEKHFKGDRRRAEDDGMKAEDDRRKAVDVYADHSSEDRSERTQDIGSIRREIKLQSVCSNSLVQMNDRSVFANHSHTSLGLHGEEHLNFITIDEGIASRFWIQQPRTGNFLCFNRTGRPIIRRQLPRKPLCVFRQSEKIHAGELVIKLQSLYNATWHLGFGKKGQPLPGVSEQFPDRCYWFQITNLDRHTEVKNPFAPVQRNHWDRLNSNYPNLNIPDAPVGSDRGNYMT